MSHEPARSARSCCRATSTASSPTRGRGGRGHLDGCDYCRRRYRFEETLRRYIRTTAEERMPAGLMAKLAQLRTTDAGTSAV